ncbi:CHY zinc finger protein [Pontibacillus halophilus]|uniref:CHY zinc finger protein n=1 Tax=Pontibacillus halophilus TaxID=516704 RepID=UPI0009DB7709|nr:CHY zinc finger protein [Pontibacillus halophilus]
MTGPIVKGALIDNETRCRHYHGETDVIAIKFYCCGTYYPCHQCHDEHASHESKVWPKEQFNDKAILCGVCKYELSIHEYIQSGSHCPRCEASFNPGCRTHYHYYFER